MKTNLFKRKGWFYLPVSWLGYLFLLSAMSYCIYLFIDIDSRSHSVSDTLMNFAFNVVIVWILYSVIAYLSIRIATNKR